MRLKHGSAAWREQLNTDCKRLKELLKEKKRDDHSRYHAEHAIKMMAEAIAGIDGLVLTFSLVRVAEPKIVYRNEGKISAGFYCREAEPVQLGLRGDEFWAAAEAILGWFGSTGKRYMRKGMIEREEIEPQRAQGAPSMLAKRG